jgi:hypothetical protein
MDLLEHQGRQLFAVAGGIRVCGTAAEVIEAIRRRRTT